MQTNDRDLKDILEKDGTVNVVAFVAFFQSLSDSVNRMSGDFGEVKKSLEYISKNVAKVSGELGRKVDVSTYNDFVGKVQEFHNDMATKYATKQDVAANAERIDVLVTDYNAVKSWFIKVSSVLGVAFAIVLFFKNEIIDFIKRLLAVV